MTLAALAFFIRVEHNHPEPIVDFKFFRNSVFTNTLVNNFVVFMGMMGSVFLIPIFAQTYLGYDATKTGYLFIPMAFMIVLAAPLGGALTGRVQPRFVIGASTLIAAVGIFFFTSIDARSHATNIIFPMAVMAFGIGFGMAQRTNIIASVVPQNEIGIASSILALARNIAGAFGIAVFGTILNNATESKVLEIARYSSLHASTPNAVAQFTSLIILKAQIEAYQTVFLYAFVILLVGAVLALTIKVKEEIKPSGEEVLILD